MERELENENPHATRLRRVNIEDKFPITGKGEFYKVLSILVELKKTRIQFGEGFDAQSKIFESFVTEIAVALNRDDEDVKIILVQRK